MNKLSTVLAGLLLFTQAPVDSSELIAIKSETAVLQAYIRQVEDDDDFYVLDDAIAIETQPLKQPEVKKQQQYKTRNVKITYYCPCYTCNGNTLRRGRWGAFLRDGMIASRDLPRGTRVRINNRIYVVEDRCARSGVIDIFVDKPHRQVYNMGSYRTNVQILV